MRQAPRPRGPGLKFRVRTAWRNHTGNQGCDPLQRRRPRSLEQLVELVQEAEKRGVPVRAVGSGHSWSDAALTGGFLVEPEGLANPLAVEIDLLREGVDATRLARCEAGMRLRALNDHLAREGHPAGGRALLQMGGYDAQTVAGVVSTSTHGSGIGLGPICDFVRSLDLVASDGRVYRIEPSDGPTDKQAYRRRHPDRELCQNDHWFNAARVGIGCLGVIYAVTFEVCPAYFLLERRELRRWGEVRQQLATTEAPKGHRHYEVYISPYRLGDDDWCLVTTRDLTDGPGRSWRDRHRNTLPELAARVPLTAALLNLVSDLRPSLVPRLLDGALRLLRDSVYAERSFNVLNIGTANLLPAYSSEIGVPFTAEGKHLAAIECIREIADLHRRVGSVYHTSPISLRFVKASTAYLSMMEGHDTMMIELIQMTRTEGGFELLAAYEAALYELDGRPHWGQVNSLTGAHDLLPRLYPRLDDWRRVHAELNPSRVFDSPFSKRVGLSRPGVPCPA
jgi:FAD/FMN-containing dehydrogenase